MSVKRRILGPPVPKMPFGLVELMDGLARDVLKNNPENIYEFCARHMQTLLEIRDGRAPRRLMTLEEKIANAQKKIKQRAEERRLAYDKRIAEDLNKQLASSADETPRCGDDMGCTEKTGTENVPDIQPEVKQEIIKIEKQDINKAAVPNSELKNEINRQNDVLNKVEIQELEENCNENKSNPEVLTVSDSNENDESTALTKGEPATDNTVKYSNIEINLLKVTENEAVNIKIADNDTVTEPIPEAIEEMKNNDITEEKMIPSEDKDVELCTNEAGGELVQKNDSTELQQGVETNPKDTSDEISSPDTIEKVVVVLASCDNLADNSPLDSETKQNEKQMDAPLTNHLLNDISSETPVNTEGNDHLPNEKVEDINESEKSPDDQILTVIIDSNNTENVQPQIAETDIIQPNESDPVEIVITESTPTEVESKSEQSTDVESVSELAQDIDKSNNSSMDLETAAITIQKVFRSFLFKTKTASYDDPTAVDITLLTEDKEKADNDVPNIKDRRHLGISRMDTVLQTVNEEKSLSLSTDDSSTLSSAATIIQAHVRGFLVRNKINLNKTTSSNSLIDSDAPSIPSLEADSDNIKSKTVLNIHIVPEGSHFVSRDESILTSIDLSLDSSPPSSVNLHPLGYDKSERRKQLKREDAIQSVSPPSNNSGKLSEDHDSVKEVLIVESNAETEQVISPDKAVVEAKEDLEKEEAKVIIENDSNIKTPIPDITSDEMDVVTPFAEGRSSRESHNSTKLLHSGEFHDIVVPTNVTRSDTSVVRGE